MKKIILLFTLIFVLNNVNLTNWYYNFWDIFQNCSITKELYKTPSELAEYIYTDINNDVFFYKTNSWDYYLSISWNITKIWNEKDYWEIINFSISDNLKDYIFDIKETNDNPDSISYLYLNWKMEKVKNWFSFFDSNWNINYLEKNYNEDNKVQSCIFDYKEKKCFDYEIITVYKLNNHFWYIYKKDEWDNIKIIVNIDWKDIYSYNSPKKEWDTEYYDWKFYVSNFAISPNWDYALILEEQPKSESDNVPYILIKNWEILQEENSTWIENLMGWYFDKWVSISDFWFSSRSRQYRDFYFISNNNWWYDIYYTIWKSLSEYINYFSNENDNSICYFSNSLWIDINNYEYVRDNEKKLPKWCKWKIYKNKKYFYSELFPYINWKMSVEIKKNTMIKNTLNVPIFRTQLEWDEQRKKSQIQDIEKPSWIKIWWTETNPWLWEYWTALIYLKYLNDNTEKVINNSFKYYHNETQSSFYLEYWYNQFQKWVLDDYLLYDWKEINMANYQSFENPIFSNDWSKISFDSYTINWKNNIPKNNYTCDFNSSFSWNVWNKNTTITTNNIKINKYKLTKKENEGIVKFGNKVNWLWQDKKTLIISKIDTLLKKYKEWSKNYEILNTLKNLIK